MANLFIPKKIRIGFQNRKDTFTGKLGYVIYYDEKGKIRKEASWKNWCDSKIPALELDNIPHNNYVFNKGIQRHGDWGSGRSVIRVYDPRDFEFEISVDNLIGILMHSDISKRDIVEECVFAWAGTELVLLPVNSQEYQDSVKYTAKQDEKISAKELIPGHVYSFKKSDTKLTYIGHYQYYEYSYYSTIPQINKGKRHVFYNGEYFVTPSIATLATCILNEIADDYAKLVDKFFASPHAKKFVSFKLDMPKNINDRIYFYKDIGNSTYACIQIPNYGNSMYPGQTHVRYVKVEPDENLDLKFVDAGIRTSNNNIHSHFYGVKNMMNYTIRPDEDRELRQAFTNAGYDYQKHNNFPKKEALDIVLSLGYKIGYFVNELGKEIECKYVLL